MSHPSPYPNRPLAGYRFIELAGLGPAPYAGQLLADMGADVILVNRPGGQIPLISNRGKRTLLIDLRTPEGVGVLMDLVKTADGLFEGLRPGVTERLGIGPTDCHAVNPKLVYGRMTGWGQTGPWAKTAGHDINYISITGALAALGDPDTPPPPPLNMVGDFGGGSLFLVNGLLAALLKAEKTGQGDIIDTAMIDGVSSLMSMLHSMSGTGFWTEERASNLLDGGMPYYRCYKTSDDKYMAVGAIEPQFFALMLGILKISPDDYGPQNSRDSALIAKQHALLETCFAQDTRDAWAKKFDGTDACVSPVLSYKEAPDHPQNKARGGLKSHNEFTHPRSAPVFHGQEEDGDFTIPGHHDDTDHILTEIGYDAAKIQRLKDTKSIA